MNYDLKTPCKNCPFSTTESAIRFQCSERAAEIAEQAYRNGFPCHLSADFVEEEEDFGEEGGYVPGENTQHCVGAILMFLKEDGCDPWPGIDNDEELMERLSNQVDWSAPVFDSEQEFIEASSEERNTR